LILRNWVDVQFFILKNAEPSSLNNVMMTTTLCHWHRPFLPQFWCYRAEILHTLSSYSMWASTWSKRSKGRLQTRIFAFTILEKPPYLSPQTKFQNRFKTWRRVWGNRWTQMTWFPCFSPILALTYKKSTIVKFINLDQRPVLGIEPLSVISH